MGKKTKKFLIICGIVVGAGLLLTIIGAAAGGISSIDKLATRYTWIAGPAEEEQQQTLDPSQTFDAVKVTGDADLDIMKGSEDSVKLIYPKDMGNYQMEVKDGVNPLQQGQSSIAKPFLFNITTQQLKEELRKRNTQQRIINTHILIRPQLAHVLLPLVLNRRTYS